MADQFDNILAKLSDDELSYLNDKFGIELRDRTLVNAMLELRAATLEVEKIEKRFRIRGVPSRFPHCAFCEQAPNIVGPMAQAVGGAFIFRACAIQCIAIIDEEAKNA